MFDNSQHLNDVKMRNLYKLQQSFANKKAPNAKHLLQKKLAQSHLANQASNLPTALQPLRPSANGGDLNYWEHPTFKFKKR